MVESERKKRRVVNIVELGDGGLVYIRLDDGKKYLLNGDGCWRCKSTADCFGNMVDSDGLEVICEFDFFDEVRSLFLCLLQSLVNKVLNLLSEKMSRTLFGLIERFVNVSAGMIEKLNVYECSRRNNF